MCDVHWSDLGSTVESTYLGTLPLLCSGDDGGGDDGDDDGEASTVIGGEIILRLLKGYFCTDINTFILLILSML